MGRNYVLLFVSFFVVLNVRVECMPRRCKAAQSSVSKNGALQLDAKKILENINLPRELSALIYQYAYEEIFLKSILLPNRVASNIIIKELYPRYFAINIEFNEDESELVVLMSNGESVIYCLPEGLLKEKKAANLSQNHLQMLQQTEGDFSVMRALGNDYAVGHKYIARIIGEVRDMPDIRLSTPNYLQLSSRSSSWDENVSPDNVQPRTMIEIFEHSGKELPGILGVSLSKEKSEQEEKE